VEEEFELVKELRDLIGDEELLEGEAFIKGLFGKAKVLQQRKWLFVHFNGSLFFKIIAIADVRGDNRVDVKRDMLVKTFLKNGFSDGSANERAVERAEFFPSLIHLLKFIGMKIFHLALQEIDYVFSEMSFGVGGIWKRSCILSSDEPGMLDLLLLVLFFQ
jgi:hypothetical protein